VAQAGDGSPMPIISRIMHALFAIEKKIPLPLGTSCLMWAVKMLRPSRPTSPFLRHRKHPVTRHPTARFSTRTRLAGFLVAIVSGHLWLVRPAGTIPRLATIARLLTR